ncbi:MAG TPA: hypothetical protein VNJ46_07700 [Gaiellaceae bacterium]|nr:hypothetical protein [Gaiellaceae bacterium]
MIVRILLWSLFDSKSTIDELREKLPPLPAPSAWLWSEGSERFGVVAFGDELPPAVREARDLIGAEPAVYEEFDVLAL